MFKKRKAKYAKTGSPFCRHTKLQDPFHCPEGEKTVGETKETAEF